MAESNEQLISQALACEKAGNFNEALDIYEELERRGAATPELLVAQGHCLLKTRQRQNAMDLWFRVLQLQPDFPPVVEALNQYFPNWEGRFQKFVARGQRVAPREATPPPRPIPSSAAPSDLPPPPPPATPAPAPSVSLTVETVTPPPRPAPVIQPPRMAPPEPAQPAAAHPISAFNTGPTQGYQAGPRYSDAAEVSEEDIMDSRVNWKYILADAQEEAAANARP